MEGCQNKNILKEKEMHFCKNCGVIHGYSWIEYDFKFNEYNENIYHLSKCKNTIYKRKKYLNKRYDLDNYYLNHYLFRSIPILNRIF